MAHSQSLIPSSYQSLRLVRNSASTQASCSGGVPELDCEMKCWNWNELSIRRFNRGCSVRTAENMKANSAAAVLFRRNSKRLLLRALGDDVAAVNGVTSFSTDNDNDVDSEPIANFNRLLDGGDEADWIIKSLHDAARAFELAMKERGLITSLSWFSAAWLGIDRTSWVKMLSYQGAVYSLLQAATEIASRGEGRDRDVNIVVQRSLIRQRIPLESMIKDKLSAKQPAYQWFWSEQVPAVVASFVSKFEEDARFSAATSLPTKRLSSGVGSKSDIFLLLLSLASMAAIIKLGPAKFSCTPLSSLVAEETGRLMDLLVDFIPISQAYNSMKNLGLRREFLLHFGPRAASCRVVNDSSSSEVIFWIGLVQEQLQKAIDRERIWSKLTTSESIEVLDKDLAIFGFFAALGKSSQSFLRSNGFDDLDHSFEQYIRYLIGGSSLYYPQLQSISSYQLFIEVVCEELDWLPFYQESKPQPSHDHQVVPPNADAIPIVIDVCSHWMQSFIKYSKWLESPSNIKAARFLSQGHGKFMDCLKDLGLSRLMKATKSGEQSRLKKSDSFGKALESVEEALVRLESLLEELHVSKPNSEKEQLEAACSDLEKIRKLKKQAEFLEASFRAKAASLQEEENIGNSSTQRPWLLNWKSDKRPQPSPKRNSEGFWRFFYPQAPEVSLSTLKDGSASEPVEGERFRVLRNELIKLEQQVGRSTSDYNINIDDEFNPDKPKQLESQKEENFVGKSLDKIKRTSLDVLQGTQLLAIDTATATGFLRRALVGDELTDKERKALSRTLTDLVSVVPIGILMLLPVTAVGHAAILAAIQRYMPTLIPSTYGRERLDLLRYLERMKELETNAVEDAHANDANL